MTRTKMKIKTSKLERTRSTSRSLTRRRMRMMSLPPLPSLQWTRMELPGSEGGSTPTSEHSPACCSLPTYSRPNRACSTPFIPFLSLFNLSLRCYPGTKWSTAKRTPQIITALQPNKYHRINSTQPAITEPMMTESRRRRELIIPTIELSAGT